MPQIILGLAMTQQPCEEEDAYVHVVHFHSELVPPHLEPEHPQAWYHRLGNCSFLGDIA